MFGLSWRRKSSDHRTAAHTWDLDQPLLMLSPQDAWTIRDALEGTIGLGATGSGKTSGSGCPIALAMLRAGFGGTVLTAKRGERELWESYCRATGRLGDLRVIGDGKLCFNFLNYEAKRPGAGGGISENIVNIFSTVLEAADRTKSGGGGQEDQGFWRRSMRQLVRNCVDLLLLAGVEVSIPSLYRVVISAPQNREQAAAAAWREKSLCFQCLQKAESRAQNPTQQRDFDLVADYFLFEFANLSEKTRSVVVSSFTSLIDVLNRGLLRELFSTTTNITPDVVEEGKIVVIDLPVKEFAEIGVLAQVLWKYMFQRAIERRDVKKSPRPVFLMADEAQYFITSYDQQFQTTCRAARVATVLLSQNVSNFYAALGHGDAGRAEADSLFGNLNTRIFHANGDPITNEWASSLIGRSRQLMSNGGNSQSRDWWTAMTGLGDPGQCSAGFSEIFEYEVQPAVFTRLRTGGPANGGIVDAIVVRNGKVFRQTGKVWLPVMFRQNTELEIR
ncbi:MAG: TraM recognition domain-containing protein [Phycisphaerae bacterium]|nr:TraM recognition domain-containing protein [Phycisphaerae bacterium]